MSREHSADPRLLDLGLTSISLTQDQCQQLDEQGYVILEEVIDPVWLGRLRAAFETLCEEEGDEAGQEVAQIEGVRRLADLVNKGEVFDDIYLQPQLLAAVGHVLRRPFKLHSLNGHDPLPGHGQQALHADWGGERGPGRTHVVNSMWMLDDMTPHNGATRIVPGSHLFEHGVREEMEDPMDRHPDEICLTGRAGSVGVFNGSVWHGCTMNRTRDRSRRLLHCAFIAREHAQQTDQQAYLRPATSARLGPLARYLLDVDRGDG